MRRGSKATTLMLGIKKMPQVRKLGVTLGGAVPRPLIFDYGKHHGHGTWLAAADCPDCPHAIYSFLYSIVVRDYKSVAKQRESASARPGRGMTRLIQAVAFDQAASFTDNFLTDCERRPLGHQAPIAR